MSLLKQCTKSFWPHLNYTATTRLTSNYVQLKGSEYEDWEATPNVIMFGKNSTHLCLKCMAVKKFEWETVSDNNIVRDIKCNRSMETITSQMNFIWIQRTMIKAKAKLISVAAEHTEESWNPLHMWSGVEIEREDRVTEGHQESSVEQKQIDKKNEKWMFVRQRHSVGNDGVGTRSKGREGDWWVWRKSSAKAWDRSNQKIVFYSVFNST